MVCESHILLYLIFIISFNISTCSSLPLNKNTEFGVLYFRVQLAIIDFHGKIKEILFLYFVGFWLLFAGPIFFYILQHFGCSLWGLFSATEGVMTPLTTPLNPPLQGYATSMCRFRIFKTTFFEKFLTIKLKTFLHTLSRIMKVLENFFFISKKNFLTSENFGKFQR